MSDKVVIAPAQGFLRVKQVLSIVPVSKSTWWDGVKNGLYPKPVRLSKRTSAWRVKDIRELMERLNSGEDVDATRPYSVHVPELSDTETLRVAERASGDEIQ